MIEIENLTKKFDGLTAVDSVTLNVNDGEVFGFLGPNGAGKTTTVRMLCCLISKTSGDARIGGYRISDDADSLKIRKIIGLVPDNVGLYEDLSAYDNLDFYGKLYDCGAPQRKESIKRFLTMLGLWDKRDAMVGTFSKGMKQKLAIARALIHEPQVIFMDEPTANLDPEASKTVRDFILSLKKEKRTIFLNTHNLDEAQRVCDRIGVLKTRLIAVGSPSDLERSMGGRRTVIQLREPVSEAVLAAVRKLPLQNVQADGAQLSVEAKDPENENSTILESILKAGGHVQSVSIVGSTLEDVYFGLVSGEKQ